MSEPILGQPPGEVIFESSWTPQEFKDELRSLGKKRERLQKEAIKAPRRTLSVTERTTVLNKTGGNCHICGGRIVPEFYWEADHVLRRCVGGSYELDNYLAAHGLCNTYRWDHLPAEIQWILKIGVWAKRQLESDSDLGERLLGSFVKYEQAREGRKKPPKAVLRSPSNLNL